VEWHHFETCSPIFAADSQRWLVMTSPWPDLDGQTPDLPGGIAFASDDGGDSWKEIVTVFPGTKADPTAWEQKIIRLSDGRLLVVCWSFDPNTNRPINNRYAISVDDGRSFGPPTPSPMSGETCTPIALQDNQVLCVYRRFDTPGLWAHLGRIKGDAWISLADEAIWGGSLYSPEVESKGQVAKMAQLQFGLPTLARLRNGEIMAAFWCMENNVSNIRWYSVRVTP
jgi:sialidase-1